MNPWRRLLLLTGIVILFLYIGAKAVGPEKTLVVAYLTNIVAAPFGQMLTCWIDTGHSLPPKDLSPQKGLMANALSSKSPSGANTALLVATSSVYTLLITNFTMTVQLNSLDQLEQAKLLSFTDLGYIEVQKYLDGSLFLVIGFTVITLTCVALALSARRLSFWMFCGGVATSLPLYFLAAPSLGLSVGFGDVTEPSTALGGVLPTVPGYRGFNITADLIQWAMLLAFGLGLSLYMWLTVSIIRAIKVGVRHVYLRVNRIA